MSIRIPLLFYDLACIQEHKNIPQMATAFSWGKTILLVEIHSTPRTASILKKAKLTGAVAVVPNPAVVAGHLELGAEALALGGGGLEEDGGQLSGAAPLAAGQLRGPQLHLLRTVLVGGWGSDFRSFTLPLG